ncbi:MAG: hypothetical protein OXB84_04540 [Halobacteriovoraceae bacterium]|nr:hypothetical protein [Halobacteriovoraceae bacterium]
MENLDKEFKFYNKNKNEFLSKYENKFIVIFNQKVIDVFDDEMTAINETVRRHQLDLGTFLVQHVVTDDIAFFHSRVSLKNVC